MFDQITAIRTFDAPADVVRQAWVASTTIVSPVTEVEMDPRVGGRIRVSTGGPAQQDLAGTFLLVDKHRLTYTWMWGGSGEETLVDVQFHDVGAQTVVEVKHSGFLSAASHDDHRTGWQTYFDGLKSYL